MDDFLNKGSLIRTILKTEFEKGFSICGKVLSYEEIDFMNAARLIIADAIEKLPRADVKPVVHGEWILREDGSAVCSKCHRVQHNCWDLDNWDNFCHHCGADMRY